MEIFVVKNIKDETIDVVSETMFEHIKEPWAATLKYQKF